MAETTSDKKWGGKYSSPEELEKGFQSLVNEITKIKAEKEVASTKALANERLVEEMKHMYAAQAAANQPSPKPIYNDGQLDENALLGFIDSKIKQVEAKLAEVPSTITQTLQSLFGPMQAVSAASNEFFARDDLDESFSAEVMNKFLARNPGIRKVYDVMVANPQTAAEAYEYAYGQWRTTRPTSGSAVDANKKRDAGTTPRSGGTPLDIPGEGQPDAKALAELARKARRSADPVDQLAYFKARLEGTGEIEDLRKIAQEKGWRE